MFSSVINAISPINTNTIITSTSANINDIANKNQNKLCLTGIIDFDLLRYVAYFGKTVSICMPIVISIVSYIILNCILLRGEKYKIYFKEFDKYKSSQRCKLHFLSVGLIAIIILYGFSPFLLLFEWK